jgi:hypothetical protein
MVGNATQDFGQLTGVAGSAGVAIGQMGEYMADAALSGEKLGSIIGNFAKVAGPVAALAVAFQAITSAQANAQQSAALTAESVEAWTKAMKEGGDVAANMTGLFEDQGKVILDNARNFSVATNILTNLPVIGWFGDKDQEDITGLFKAAAIGMDEYTRAVVEGAAGEQRLRKAIDQSNLSEEEKSKLLDKLGDDIEDYNKASENRARNEKIFATNARAANAILQQIVAKQAPLEQFTEQWDILFGDMRDGTIDTDRAAAAIDLLAKNLGLTREEVVAIAEAELGKQIADAAAAADKAARSAANRVRFLNDQFVDQANAAYQAGLEMSDLIDALKEYDQLVSSGDFGAATVQGAVSAFQQLTSKRFALDNLAQEGEEAWKNLADTITTENGKLKYSRRSARTWTPSGCGPSPG